VKRAVACAFALSAAAYAGEVMETEVTHDEGRYAVRFDVRLDAPPDRLKHFLTDYEHYTTYFTAVSESQVLAHAADGSQRVRLKFNSCVLFFCRDVTFVKDIAEAADGSITARVIAAESDFREATEQWQITPDDGQTRLQYRAELVPSFYVPPLIGPLLMKIKIRSALESGAARLEALAHDGTEGTAAAAPRPRNEPIGDQPMESR
jgi:polyketide cyclase/dehydrase/lipid transport protein